MDSFDTLLAFISFYVHWLFRVCYPQFFAKNFYFFITINKKIAKRVIMMCAFLKKYPSQCAEKIFYIFFMSDFFVRENFF